jgi:hypothetical protein
VKKGEAGWPAWKKKTARRTEEAEEAVASRYLASRRPGTPWAASSPRGGADVAPSNGSLGLLLLPPHPLLRLLRAVVWTGDGTPRQLGLKARGGAVAAYL